MQPRAYFENVSKLSSAVCLTLLGGNSLAEEGNEPRLTYGTGEPSCLVSQNIRHDEGLLSSVMTASLDAFISFSSVVEGRNE